MLCPSQKFWIGKGSINKYSEFGRHAVIYKGKLCGTKMKMLDLGFKFQLLYIMNCN